MVAKISLDPAKRATLNTGQQQQQSQQKLQQTPAEITPNAAGVQKDTVSKEEPVSNKNAESKTGQAVAPESAAEAPSPKEIKAEPHSTATDKSTPSNNVSPSESNGAAEPAPSKSIQKFRPAEPSVFKYIDGKLYHPSKRYDDLQGLSIDKSGNFDLIQVIRTYHMFKARIHQADDFLCFFSHRELGKCSLHRRSIIRTRRSSWYHISRENRPSTSSHPLCALWIARYKFPLRPFQRQHLGDCLGR